MTQGSSLPAALAAPSIIRRLECPGLCRDDFSNLLIIEEILFFVSGHRWTFASVFPK
jgi:hypothetical protein